jgi:hypothetical protein
MRARMENFLDAKYNNYMDSTPLRLALIAAGFAAWLGVSVTVLKLV